MIELLTSIISGLKEPLLVLLFVVLVALFYLLLRREKTVADLNTTIAGLHEIINTNMAEGNETIAKLVTLVEFVVYGRGRNGNP